MEAKAILDPNVPSRINLLNVRIAYADGLNAPKEGKADASGKKSPPKFSCSVLIPEGQAEVLNQVQQVMWNVALAKWQNRAQVVWQELSASGKLAMRNGAAKASQEGFMGHWFISLSAKPESPPRLLSQYVDGNGKVVELPRPQNVIYGGCFVNIQIDFWPQDHPEYGKRINAEVKLVQFAGDGTSFGGGASADDSVFAQHAQPQPAGFAGFGAAPAAPVGFTPQGAAPQTPGFPAGMTGMPQPGAAMGAPQFQQPQFQQPQFQQPQFQQPQFQQPAAQAPAPQAGFAPSMPTPGAAFSGGFSPQAGNPGMPQAGFAPQQAQQSAPWAPI